MKSSRLAASLTALVVSIVLDGFASPVAQAQSADYPTAPSQDPEAVPCPMLKPRFGIKAGDYRSNNKKFRGAYVLSVDNGMPASKILLEVRQSDGTTAWKKASLYQGDIITRVNGHRVCDTEEMGEELELIPPGSEFNISGYDSRRGYAPFRAKARLVD